VDVGQLPNTETIVSAVVVYNINMHVYHHRQQGEIPLFLLGMSQQSMYKVVPFRLGKQKQEVWGLY
jgi:hypothetical protein